MDEINIDLTKVKDVHEELTDKLILAGLTNYKAMMKVRKITLPVNLTLVIPLIKRGVHMSRLISIINFALNNHDYIENNLRKICKEVDKKIQKGCKIIAKFSYPLNYSDQFLNVRIELKNEFPIKYIFTKLGVTACPCSKEITGIGHMQRAILRIELESNEILDFEEIAKKMEECFSASPSEYLRRIDEAKLIIKSQKNTRFVEDIVRECIKKFSSAIRIEAKAFESIHAHDAYAIWYRKLTKK